MNKICSLRPSLVVGGLTATVALLAGMNLANAQAPAPAAPLSGAGSFPQSFIVPGTNTSLHVGGQIQIDAGYGMDDFGAGSLGAYDNLAPATVGVEGPGALLGAGSGSSHNNEGTFRFTADNSKLFTETRTPSAYGEMKTYIEFDFQGGQVQSPAAAVGSTTIKCCADDGIPRLRMAYGTLGPWLIGKAASNFVDLAAIADTLDGFVEAGGFMGAGTFRQTQVRYTYLLPNGISLAGSIESAASGGTIAFAPNGTTRSNFNNFDAPGISQRIPAFVGKAVIQQPWGHAQLALAVMQERLENDGLSPNADAGNPTGAVAAGAAVVPGGVHFARWGYMLDQSGHINTFGNDKFTWSAAYGQGAAQYSWPLSSPDLGTNWEEGIICSAINQATTATVTTNATARFTCAEPRTLGVNIGYSHFWTSEWRSGIGLGWDQESRTSATAGWITGAAGAPASGSAASLAALEHRHYSAAGSLFWTPLADVQFGLTYIWYHRETWSGARGNSQRLESQALFRF